MAKKVTITYTREDLDTPWYWQLPSGFGTPAFNDYLTQNSDKISHLGYLAAQGYKNIVVTTFSDDQTYQEFAAIVGSDIAPGYKEYCETNNITIEHVVEDI